MGIESQPPLVPLPDSKDPEKLKGFFKSTRIEREPKVESNNKLIESYKVFQQELNADCNIIYYPSCATDISSSKAFPKSRVIYLDTDQASINTLQKNGLEAHQGNLQEFDPESPIDVLILLNPATSGEIPSRFVKVGGHVLCNDYHQTATEFKEDSHFKLLGIIRQKNKKFFLDQENPEDYWKQVETDEEYKKVNPYLFELAKKEVVKIRQTDQNILKNYLEILDESEKDGGMRGFDKDNNIIGSEPPRKKGHMDDVFVFKKISENKDEVKFPAPRTVEDDSFYEEFKDRFE